MARIPFAQHGFSPWERLLGHAPEILERWIALEDAFFSSGTLTPRLREQVRRTLAFANGCQYCMAKAGPPESGGNDHETTLAVELASRFAGSQTALSEQEIAELRAGFSEKAIVELLAFIAFITASQRFGAALGLQPAERYHNSEGD